MKAKVKTLENDGSWFLNQVTWKNTGKSKYCVINMDYFDSYCYNKEELARRHYNQQITE